MNNLNPYFHKFPSTFLHFNFSLWTFTSPKTDVYEWDRFILVLYIFLHFHRERMPLQTGKWQEHLLKQISWGTSLVRGTHSRTGHPILLSFGGCQPPNKAKCLLDTLRKGYLVFNKPPPLLGLRPGHGEGKESPVPMPAARPPLPHGWFHRSQRAPHPRVNPSVDLSSNGQVPHSTLYFFTSSFWPRPGVVSSRTVPRVIICRLTSITMTFLNSCTILRLNRNGSLSSKTRLPRIFKLKAACFHHARGRRGAVLFSATFLQY